MKQVLAVLFMAIGLLLGGLGNGEAGISIGNAPSLRWHRQIGYCRQPGVADINGDNVLDLIIAAESGLVQAVSGSNGQAYWEFRASGGFSSSPAVADLNADGILEIVLCSLNGRVYALSARDGRVLWSFKGIASFTSSPLLCDVNGSGPPEVIAASGDGRVYALTGARGKVYWTQSLGGAITSSPAAGDLDGDRKPEVVVATATGAVDVLRGKDGARLYTQNVEYFPLNSPLLADTNNDGRDDVIIAGKFVSAIGYDGRHWKRLWSFNPEGPAVCADPVLGDLTGDGVPEVIVSLSDGIVASVRLRDGALLWKSKPIDRMGSQSSPIVCASGNIMGIILASSSGNLTALAGSDGGVVWQQFLAGRTDGCPVVADFDGDGIWEVGVGVESGDFFVYSTGLSGSVQWAKPRGDLFNSGNAAQALAFARSVSAPVGR